MSAENIEWHPSVEPQPTGETEFFMFHPDPQDPRRAFYGTKHSSVVTESDAEPPYPTPFTATRVVQKFGFLGAPATFTTDYKDSDFGPGSPPVISVTAVDEANTMYTVTYYPYGVTVGEDRATHLPQNAWAVTTPIERQLKVNQEEMLHDIGYYRLGDLPPRLNHTATAQLFDHQVGNRIYHNPRLVAF